MKRTRRVGSKHQRRRAGSGDGDAFVLGVVRAIVGPESEGERDTYVFAVDTRKYGRGRLLSHLPELDAVETQGVPTGATVTPRLYAVAGSTSSIHALARRTRRRLDAFVADLQRRPLPEIRAHLERQRVSLDNQVQFDTLFDLFCSELADGKPGFAQMLIVPIEEQYAVLGLYRSEGPLATIDADAIEAALEGWLKVESRPGVDRPLTAHDVREMINNPIYGYGLVLEPTGDLVETVDDFVHALADQPTEFAVQSLDREFCELFARLEASGRFRRGPAAPPLVSKELWLGAQLARIRRIRTGEPEQPVGKPQA